MKYQEKITIKAPLLTTVALLDNPDNMQYWQKDLLSYELLSGEPGTVGSTMYMTYLQGKREFTLLETIIENDFPHHFSASYQCKGVVNIVANTFTENTDGHTVWKSDNEFKFFGFMKVMSWFMPQSMFRKKSCQYLHDFKTFAESSVNE